MRKLHGQYLVRDLWIVALSVVIAILLVKIGALSRLFSYTEEAVILGSFIAGLFFTSVFTLAPASIALAELGENHPALIVALCGAFGAMLGDLVLFLFIRDSVSDDIEYMTKKLKIKKWLSLFHLGFLRLFAPVIGALIIASPLPDELGISLMGISKTRTSVLIPVAFVMNFIGVLIIIGIARLI